MYIVVIIQSHVKWECGTMRNMSCFCYFFSNCLEYLSLKFISKQSFIFSCLTAHCSYLNLAFLLFCSVLWIFYNLFYIFMKSVAPWRQGLCPVYIRFSEHTHNIRVYTWFRGHSVSDKLTWFLSRIIFYYISNIPA